MRAHELEGGDDGRVGSRYRVAWRSRIPYVLEFDFTVRGLEKERWTNALGPLARPAFEHTTTS